MALSIQTHAVFPPARQPAARERILVVEDDTDVRRMYAILFARRGYAVTQAGDGDAAFELAVEGQFDLVLTELELPRVDGWALLGRLRDDFRTRELPVALLSADDGVREALRLNGVGAQAYLSKHTRLELLAQQVHLLLEPARRIRRAVETVPPEAIALTGIGPQRVLRSIAEAAWAGTIAGQTGDASFAVAFRRGNPLSAAISAGGHRVEGEGALNAFIASQGLEGTLTAGSPDGRRNLWGDAQGLLAAAIRRLNANAAAVRDNVLVRARRVEVNPALYGAYEALTEDAVPETARLICEQALTPAQVLGRSDRSPLEVEAEVLDLVRRRVVRLAM